MTEANKELRRQLAAAQRSGKRQAAPFSKGGRTDKPRRPGRKPGMGNFSYRKPPSADELSGAASGCVGGRGTTVPDVGGVLEQEGVDVAYVTDIPAMPRPQVTEYRVQVCRCRGCGRRVRGQHPEVGPDQYGTSAHRMGRRVMAAAHMLHYGVGIPVRRVPSVLRALTGVELRPERDHPGRHCAEPGGLWEKRTVGFGSLCVRARWCTPTTRAGEWAESLRS